MVLEIPSLVVTQSTVAYIGPLYGKVVGVAIYSIHTLYSKYPYFWSNRQPDKDMFCDCMHLYELF